MPNKSNSLTIGTDGSIRFIWADELADMLSLGAGKVTRASHVEPNESGQWEADLSPVSGPKLGPYKLRGEALAAELAWLQAHGF